MQRNLPIYALLLLTVVLAAPATAATASGASTITDDAPAAAPALALDEHEPEDNETRPPHKNPDEVREDGDLEAVSDLLIWQLSRALGDSTIELSESEYELAREHLGDDYDERLGKLVEVAGETDRDSDEQAAETLAETRDEQREFANTVEEYHDTYEEYQQAKEEGDERRARELARELEERANRADESATRLEGNYDDLEESTGVDFEETTERVRAEEGEIAELQEEVREEEFVGTELSIEPEGERISFLEPLEATGQLTGADGEPVADEDVRLEIGSQTIATTTDADGEFSFTYRPTLLPLATERLNVTYRPDPESVYLSSGTSVSVTVSQVDPDIDLAETPAEAGFGDTVTVRGEVTAEGVAVADVPVVLTIGGERIGETNTSADGTFAIETALPATVPASEQELRVRLPLSEQALAEADARESIRIAETETALTVAGEDRGNATAQVDGRLTMADGTPVADRPVALRIDGETVTTTRTGAEGHYETNITVPARHFDEAGEATVEIAAVYAEPGNLADARATTTLTVTGSSDADTEDGGDGGLVASLLSLVPFLGSGGAGGIAVGAVVVPWWAVIAVSTALLALAGWAYVARPASIVAAVSAIVAVLPDRITDRLPFEPEGTDNESPPDGAVESGGEPAEAEDDDTPSDPLATARDRLTAADPDGAIEAAYLAVRPHLAQVSDDKSLTPWEFHRVCRNDGLDEESLDSLTTLTENYERAVFTPRATSHAHASESIEAAERLVSN